MRVFPFWTIVGAFLQLHAIVGPWDLIFVLLSRLHFPPYDRWLLHRLMLVGSPILDDRRVPLRVHVVACSLVLASCDRRVFCHTLGLCKILQVIA